MPSDARKQFRENYKDVERLLEIHTELAGEGPGRRHGVEVLNKSGIVLMCAIWEAYCEDMASEAVEHLIDHAEDATGLPKALRTNIAKELKADKNDSAMWKLADDSWRELLRSRTARLTAERNRRLNTPKTANIRDLFDDAVGMPKVTTAWRWAGINAESAGRKLDKYVTLRGDIAHRAQAAQNIKRKNVSDFAKHVGRLVEKTDEYVNGRLDSACGKPLF